MKKSNFFLFFTFVIFNFCIYAVQAQNQIVFVFEAPEGEEIIKEDHNLHEKSCVFWVRGLETTDEVSAFVEKAMAINGVKLFSISETVQDGQRTGSGTFDGCSSLEFFQKFLTDTGVGKLLINGQELTPDELHTVWKSRQGNQSESPTNPSPELLHN
ncbi:MAG: hypothetical protein PHT69_09895 [Bacteroidales bacterium]|nr:hypothetical protein [Bacteroidales bacterium]